MNDTTSFSRLNIDERGVAWLTLDRPEVHNAFDDALIEDLNDHLDRLHRLCDDGKLRALVLRSEGKHFSAGADLAWMKRMVDYEFDDNLADSRRLSHLMHCLDTLACPTLCLVQGATYGGAVGLVACCDIAVASEKARFCLSEVRIGLAPAVISPYVQRAIGERQMRRYALSAEVISASLALELGLVHRVVEHDKLENARDEILDTLLACSPQSQKATKALLAHIAQEPDSAATRERCCRVISELRISHEGQEGLSAFFEKRSPRWQNDEEPS
ncbi:enoyl-CoA hydratase/isomerase family protein [Pistricoccus aurantiacus]|uniref:Enoyl-CoA hydratase/isomerase family protein n=1 Tax=Pistricoccus aurantiacus TaxID=1883414 RepID=A0A5B8SSN7_9GAMM|nr:enoyl-CoA hydratase-related protein [Pistricoccus aurantiacus]QEA40089.1 enoyl-CoA hydratase/isomerase family protein [Pistricoccus aurantiacus]